MRQDPPAGRLSEKITITECNDRVLEIGRAGQADAVELPGGTSTLPFTKAGQAGTADLDHVDILRG